MRVSQCLRSMVSAALIVAFARDVSRAQDAPKALEASTTALHTVDLGRLRDPSQFEFLAPILRDVEVVSLGESIHLTSEFPLVRIGIVRFLAEQLGFQTLALEGSAEDLWVAQDRLLASPKAVDDISRALSGFFPIWDTNDMRELLDFEVRSWTTPHPFYITAYDIQPGTSVASRGREVFRQLTERLEQYAPPPPNLDKAHLVDDLAPLTNSCGNYARADSARVDAAIASLARWIALAAPVVETRTSNGQHVAVLRLIPENLRASHRLCLGRMGEGWARYKSVRDTNAAQYALALKAVAPNNKLMVWAHLSHVSHNSAGAGVSVGQILHRELGERLYTIMPFAEGGTTALIYSDVNDDVAYGRVRGTNTPLGKRLSALASTDYFLDLRTAQRDSLFVSPQRIAVEAETMNVTLARDFDGILWIKRVHPPHFVDGSTTRMFVGLSLWHYRLGLSGVVMIGIVLLIARRRMRPAQPTEASI